MCKLTFAALLVTFGYSTTNPGQPLAAKESLGGPLLCGGPPKGNLAAKSCPRFVVEFNSYNIILMSPMLLTTLLKRRLQFSVISS